jgi:hypothetical protein
MRYISVFTHPPDPNATGPSPEMMAKMGALVEEGMKAGWLITTEGVHFGEKGLKVNKTGREISIVDGPFTEAKEVIGGYAILEAPNREAVIELTRKFLSVAGDGTCEIHELYVEPMRR